MFFGQKWLERRMDTALSIQMGLQRETVTDPEAAKSCAAPEVGTPKSCVGSVEVPAIGDGCAFGGQAGFFDALVFSQFTQALRRQ
jgi:hypothetical protein